jgi:hypothetical protein
MSTTELRDPRRHTLTGSQPDARSNGHGGGPEPTTNDDGADSPLSREEQAEAFFRFIIGPPSGSDGRPLGCVEARIFDADQRRGFIFKASQYKKTFSGWFDGFDAYHTELGRLRGASAYVTVNPVRRDLLARLNNRLDVTKDATKDTDILCIRFLYLDIDPKRPTGVSSTDAELAAALAKRDQILADHPEFARSAIWGCSGNGAWMLVLLPDYPNDEPHWKLIADALDSLRSRYNDGTVEIDEKPKNPSRVMCCVGTLKCKGDSLPERPHRWVTMDSPAGERPPFDLAEWLKRLPVPAGDSATASTPREEPSAQDQNGIGTMRVGGLSVEERAALYLKKCEPSIAGERGHDKLLWAAKIGPGFDLTRDATFRLLKEHFDPLCDPSWSDKEIWHKVDEAFKTNDKPRGYLRDAGRNGDNQRRDESKSKSSQSREETQEERAKLLANYRPKTFGQITKGVGELKHLWPDWLVIGNLSLIFSKPKQGKTRSYLRLIKTLAERELWPDGAPNEWPEGTKTLVLPYDRNHAEIDKELKLIDCPDWAAVCPSDPRDPTGVSLLSLTDPLMLDVLELSLKDDPAIKLVVIDTLTYASEKSLSKPEDMKAMLDGVMMLATRYAVAVLVLIHENKDGEALGRRIVERARVIMRLERYSEQDPTRLRLYVKESNFPRRPSLSVTHTDKGVVFEADKGATGNVPDRMIACARWLVDYLWGRSVDFGQGKIATDEVDYGTLIAAAGGAGFAGERNEESGYWSNPRLLDRAIKAINGKDASVEDLHEHAIERREQEDPRRSKPRIFYRLKIALITSYGDLSPF